ncbi:hypothetical protein O3P69_001441 [Scylla paramamosain]|uniref:Uncharacterized protein n=1 Tax=Scylla paramamosain TaxID=85552 RepID=A0AAW0UZ36_SCYPA
MPSSSSSPGRKDGGEAEGSRARWQCCVSPGGLTAVLTCRADPVAFSCLSCTNTSALVPRPEPSGAIWMHCHDTLIAGSKLFIFIQHKSCLWALHIWSKFREAAQFCLVCGLASPPTILRGPVFPLSLVAVRFSPGQLLLTNGDSARTLPPASGLRQHGKSDFVDANNNNNNDNDE